MADVMEALYRTIEGRRTKMPEGSYTSTLFAAGLPRIAQKVGEEAVETTVAALAEPGDRVVSEMADLMYHCLVLLSARGLAWSEVSAELKRRFK
jgi:phosphoribosyl-ATP pyrophosphohydrolase